MAKDNQNENFQSGAGLIRYFNDNGKCDRKYEYGKKVVPSSNHKLVR